MRRASPRRIASVVALILLQIAVVVWYQQPADAAAAQLPFTVTNNSGRSDATYVYVIARQGGRPGYVDADGVWRAFTLPTSVPAGQPNPAAPDVSMPGPGNGASKTLRLPPDLAGGRVYVSFGSKLSFALSKDGLVEPAPWTENDASHNVLFDWVELARSGTRIFINTTMVDMHSVPMSVSVTSTGGVTRTAGQLKSGGRQAIVDAVTALGGDWAKLVYKRPSDGLVLRVLAPSHGIRSAGFGSTYLDPYIAAVWQYYASHTMTVNLGTFGTYTGRASGDAMTFTNSSGTVIGTLTKPTTVEAFECSGGLQPTLNQPNLDMILAVGARVCAGLNRATLSTSSRFVSDTQPVTDASKFYQQSQSNLYAKVMHDNSVDGKAYGFSYDDVADTFSPVVDEADPASAAMTIGPISGSGTTPTPSTTTPSTTSPTSPVTGTFIKAPGGTCVDVRGDDVGGNGAIVQLWGCLSNAADQHWTLTSGTLRTLGRCMDVVDNGTADGSLVQLWDCHGGGNQQWVEQADGSIKNVGSGRCLQPVGGATANETRLEIRGCDSTALQQKFSHSA